MTREQRANWMRGAVVAGASWAVFAAAASAQSWSDQRERPLLRQITSVDATGEAGWPFGQEEVAGDGLAVFEADEAAVDLRTTYADADAERLWLRAYVTAETSPPDEVVAFFFIDTDDRDDTGGPAYGELLWPTWTADPTVGGYERAIGVRADGMVLGAFRWDAQADGWVALELQEDDVRVERGQAEDPIRIGAWQRGYLQAEVVHQLSDLNASCAGNLFVRVWHDGTEPRSFGDDDPQRNACRPGVDVYGDPTVLRSSACDADSDCPNDGRCRDRVCLFAYGCEGDADCQAGERCEADKCVRFVDASCDSSTDCDGLVCDDGACVACSESGARACAEGSWCSPNGGCVDADQVGPGADGDDDDDDGPGGAGAGKVRGGAFKCAVTSVTAAGSAGFAWLVPLAYAWRRGRRARRDADAREGRSAR